MRGIGDIVPHRGRHRLPWVRVHRPVRWSTANVVERCNWPSRSPRCLPDPAPSPSGDKPTCLAGTRPLRPQLDDHVRCRTTSKGTTGQFGVVEPGATAGRFSPGSVRLKRTAGDVRSMSRMFIRARRGFGVGAATLGTGTGTPVRLMCVMPGNSGVTNGPVPPPGRDPEGQTRRPNGQPGKTSQLPPPSNTSF